MRDMIDLHYSGSPAIRFHEEEFGPDSAFGLWRRRREAAMAKLEAQEDYQDQVWETEGGSIR